jgi:hypothetical protein
MTFKRMEAGWRILAKQTTGAVGPQKTKNAARLRWRFLRVNFCSIAYLENPAATNYPRSKLKDISGLRFDRELLREQTGQVVGRARTTKFINLPR